MILFSRKNFHTHEIFTEEYEMFFKFINNYLNPKQFKIK